MLCGIKVSCFPQIKNLFHMYRVGSHDSTGSDSIALYSLPVESCELTLYAGTFK